MRTGLRGSGRAVPVKDSHSPRQGDSPRSPPLDKGSNREERKATQTRILNRGKNRQATFLKVAILAGNEEGGIAACRGGAGGRWDPSSLEQREHAGRTVGRTLPLHPDRGRKRSSRPEGRTRTGPSEGQLGEASKHRGSLWHAGGEDWSTEDQGQKAFLKSDRRRRRRKGKAAPSRPWKRR